VSTILTFERFTVDGSAFRFLRPYTIRVAQDSEGIFSAEDERLNICAYGETLEDLAEMIRDGLASMWGWVVEEEEKNLTPHARTVRRNLLARLVKEN